MNFDFKILTDNNTDKTLSSDVVYELLILGGGPGSLNAALYAGRKSIQTGIITNNFGGQLLNTSYVDNYLGVKTTSGTEVAELFQNQISDFEIPVLKDVFVTSISKRNNLFEVETSNKSIYYSKTIILALGANPRKLKIANEDKYSDKGISYCAICDGPLYKGKTVIVAGGGNSAVEAALDLSKIASKVVLVHRSKFRADQVLIDKLYSTSNIDINLETIITEIEGSSLFEAIVVKGKDNSKRVINGSALFIEIGNIPNTEIVRDLVDVNEYGEVIVDKLQRTNVDGLFAVGDMTDSKYKQIIIAASEGAKAALAVNEYLNSLEEE